MLAVDREQQTAVQGAASLALPYPRGTVYRIVQAQATEGLTGETGISSAFELSAALSEVL